MNKIFKKRKILNKIKGFTLVEIFLSLGVLTVITYAFVTWSEDNLRMSVALVYRSQINNAIKVSSTILKHQSNYFDLLQTNTNY